MSLFVRGSGFVKGLGFSICMHLALGSILLSVEPQPTSSNRYMVEIKVQEKIPQKPKEIESSPPPKKYEEKKPVTPKTDKPVVNKTIRKVEKKVESVSETRKVPDTKAIGTSPTRSFGIRLENTITASTGGGLPVPVGDTIEANPKIAAAEKRTEFHGEEVSDKPHPIHSVKIMPKLIKDAQAEYPFEARKLGIEGKVVLEIVIDENGAVASVRVIKGLHPILDASAISAAKKLKFSPAIVDGQPVKVKIPYTYIFVLE